MIIYMYEYEPYLLYENIAAVVLHFASGIAEELFHKLLLVQQVSCFFFRLVVVDYDRWIRPWEGETRPGA